MHFVTEKKIKALSGAIDESVRFIDRANKAITDLRKEEFRSNDYAAAKRASMDLTRALAEVRRNHWDNRA